MQGRFHFYEGYTPQQVVFPVRVMRLLGAEILIVTAAAGGLNPAMAAGSVMLLNDHIGLPLLAGNNPLRGANDERFGVRFPSTTGAYDSELAALAQEAATERGVHLYEGVYAMVSGPSFESPAEIRFLRQAGADAVGMSTVPEVVAARHLNMRVMALCCVTNAALSDSEQGVEPKHEDVLAVAAAAGEDLAAIVEGVIMRAGSAAAQGR
jgi:purine-nucleoside phosphorylase